MKISRSTRLFRGQLDLAPFLCVLFPLAFAALFSGFLVLPRGARLQLPTVDAPAAVAPGETVLVVAIDAAQRVYFENQIHSLTNLEAALARRVAQPDAPGTLLIQADAGVPFAKLGELAALARRAGLRQAVFGTLPPRRP